MTKPIPQIRLALTAGSEPVFIEEALGQQNVSANFRKFGHNVPHEFTQAGLVRGFSCVDINDRTIQVDAITGGPPDQVVDAGWVLLFPAIPIGWRTVHA